MDKLLTISEVADILHVSKNSLRTWDKEGKIVSVKTDGGHRRYRKSDVDAFAGFETTDDQKNEECVAVYCRVSSHDQKKHGDLDRQKLLRNHLHKSVP